VLFSAWRKLCGHPDWDADLIVAGYGRTVDFWRREAADAGIGDRISVLGFTDRVPDLLAAADLLVSPVRYESYGLNVAEAICSGVPAMVTESAGVAERYPTELREMLITDPEDAEDLTAMILRWRGAIGRWKQSISSFSEILRLHTLDAMAAQIVSIAESDSSGNRKHRISA
jgi:glycosyltransferase involved in cell wall biosynthesis